MFVACSDYIHACSFISKEQDQLLFAVLKRCIIIIIGFL